jgi:hypothetical protein
MTEEEEEELRRASQRTFFSRFKLPLDNPIVSGIIKFASHPITGLGVRGLALGMAASNPVSLGIVIGTQSICVGIDTAREYRASRLKEREKLVDHYGEMIQRLDIALAKLEPDPKKRELIKSKFNNPQQNPKHEKAPRKDLDIGTWQYRLARFIEWGTAVIMDTITTHGVGLFRNLPIDILPEVLTMGSTSEAVGTYAKRKIVLQENSDTRKRITEKAQKFGIPSYNRSTVQLGEHLGNIERDVRALESLAKVGAGYDENEFKKYRAEEERKPASLKPESRLVAGLKSLGGAIFGSAEDYSWITEAPEKIRNWFNDPKKAPGTVELTPLKSKKIEANPELISDKKPSKSKMAEKVEQIIKSAEAERFPGRSEVSIPRARSHSNSVHNL